MEATIVVRTCMLYERYAPHNDVSVIDGPIGLYYIILLNYIILYYHCVTTAYSIQYSNTLYSFVA